MYNKPIEINGKKFESKQAASKHFKISITKFKNIIKKYGMLNKSSYNIPEVEFIDKRSNNLVNTNNKSKTRKKYCEVKCLEDNKIYPSIASAARICKVSGWTMSVKMQVAGKFEKDGKTYIRLSSMNSKNTYKNTGATIQRNRSKWLRKNKLDKTVETVHIESTPISSMSIARDIIKTELINRINQNNWQEAEALLDVITKLQ